MEFFILSGKWQFKICSNHKTEYGHSSYIQYVAKTKSFEIQISIFAFQSRRFCRWLNFQVNLFFYCIYQWPFTIKMSDIIFHNLSVKSRQSSMSWTLPQNTHPYGSSPVSHTPMLTKWFTLMGCRTEPYFSLTNSHDFFDQHATASKRFHFLYYTLNSFQTESFLSLSQHYCNEGC